MKPLKEYFKTVRKDSNNAGPYGAPNIPSPVTAEHSSVLKFFLLLLVALSVGAVSIENGLHPLALLALIPVSAALIRRDYDQPYVSSEKSISILLLIYVAAVIIGVVLTQRRIVIPLFMVYFTFGILIARAILPLNNREISQLIFLSVGLILINCILTNHLIFGLLLPFYLFVLMGTLLVFVLDRSKRACPNASYPIQQDFSHPVGLFKLVAKCSGLIFIMTVLAFAIIPRPFLTFPGFATVTSAAGGLVGLQNYISYKDIANMSGRHRVAFVVYVEGGSLPDYPYWRGRVLDRTDGNRWDSTQTRGTLAWPVRAKSTDTFVYKFVPYRLLSQTVYAAGLPLRVEGHMGRPLYLNSRGEILLDSAFLVTDSYKITAVDRPVPAPKIASVNLDKTGVTLRITKQAQEWTSGLTLPAEKARTLERKLRTQFRYVLENPLPPENVPPLEYFLSQSRSGNCEYFAGALCLMLRAIDIPARVVEGFAGMEHTDRAGQFLVRFSHAHAWVEAALGDGNWTTLDATPPGRGEEGPGFWRFLVYLYDSFEFGWIRYVVHFDRSDQAAMLGNIYQILPSIMAWISEIKWKTTWILSALGGCLAVALVCLAGNRLFNRRSGPSKIYLQTMNSLRRKKILNRVDSWHENNLAQIIERIPESKDAARQFMEIYLKARFGSERAGSQPVLIRARDELRQSARRSKLYGSHQM
jgi:transglutaminase-like putative cysteine protease